MDKIGNLELTLLELGAEVYRLKEKISNLVEAQNSQIKSLEGLKKILEEKGVISIDDIETSIIMSQLGDDVDMFEDSYNERPMTAANKRDLN
jgi:regulator of replication initiation timing